MWRWVAALWVAGAASAQWRPLFDGETTKGWIEVTGKPFPTNCWTVEDHCLKSIVQKDGFQDIRTVESFRNFELEWEWKMLPDGNSGVKYLIQKIDEWTNHDGRQARARGLEYQLADDANEEAKLSPMQVAGALYSAIAPVPKIKPAIGEFNRSRLVVDGTHVEHWLNGTRVVSFELSAPEVQRLFPGIAPKESPISLQNHSSEVWFRNIRIRVK